LFEIDFLFEYSLARKPTAIVSSIAGTTRDVIESTIDLGGYPVVICDTAGLRITNDPIENEGVLRAFNRLVDLFSLKWIFLLVIYRADTCDLLIIVIDVSVLSMNENLNEQIDKHLSDLFTIKSSSLNSLTKLIILNKIDLVKEDISVKLKDNMIPISCISGVNIQEFLSKLTKTIAEK
jgi:tRNA modification GTPase